MIQRTEYVAARDALIDLFVLANSHENYIRSLGKSQKEAERLFRSVMAALAATQREGSMIETKQIVEAFQSGPVGTRGVSVDERERNSGIRWRRERLYLRATLVEIPEGRLVEVGMPPGDDKPSRHERIMGVLLVLSVIVLALFAAWMVVP